MSYVADTDSREIYMLTQRETKKYRNLAENPAVSLLIDTRRSDSKSQTKALTITGIFQGCIDENKKKNIRADLLTINPDLKAFVDDPSIEIIVIQVKAVQLLDGIKDSYFEIIT
jgi:general stress protein 26